MEKSWNWVVGNFNVLFSGLGVYVISVIVMLVVAVIGYFFRKKNSINKVAMKNIIAGGDVVGRDKKGS